MTKPHRPRHVVHLLYRFAAGGLENVLVQLINQLSRQEYHHTIIALTSADQEFARRLERDDVRIIELHKRPGQPFALYLTLFKTLSQLRPDVLHTCNLAALEFAPIAAIARVPLRIHAEHGWDVGDPEGRNWRYRMLRRVYRPFVHQFVAVSTQLYQYLRDAVEVPPACLHLVPNGVDTEVFRPWRSSDVPPDDFPFRRPDHWVIGTVGRLEPIKNQLMLAKAFACLVRQQPEGVERLRLAIIGGGSCANAIADYLSTAGMADLLWLPGSRSDISSLLRCLDCFVLPSLAEGTSCTLQEAMATGVPIVATAVGGNEDLLEHGRYGDLVTSMDVVGLANAMLRLFVKGEPPTAIVDAARIMVAQKYALVGMVARYDQLFRGA